jgi:hypothetical protein
VSTIGCGLLVLLAGQHALGDGGVAADLATVLQAGTADKNVINALASRFQEVQKATEEHAQLLGTTLSETEASLQTVNIQLVSLLSRQSAEDAEVSGENSGDVPHDGASA